VSKKSAQPAHSLFKGLGTEKTDCGKTVNHTGYGRPRAGDTIRPKLNTTYSSSTGKKNAFEETLRQREDRRKERFPSLLPKRFAGQGSTRRKNGSDFWENRLDSEGSNTRRAKNNFQGKRTQKSS